MGVNSGFETMIIRMGGSTFWILPGVWVANSSNPKTATPSVAGLLLLLAVLPAYQSQRVYKDHQSAQINGLHVANVFGYTGHRFGYWDWEVQVCCCPKFVLFHGLAFGKHGA